MSYGEARKRATPKDQRQLGVFINEYHFEEDAFFKTGNEKVPNLKVVGFRTKVEISELRKPAVINRHVAHLFQSLTGDQDYWVDNAGVVRKAGALLPIEQEFEAEADGKKSILHVTIDEPVEADAHCVK